MRSHLREQLQTFANEKGLSIAAWNVENESGASLKRPELFRLLDDCQSGDVLLIEQVDRLSRLNDSDWESLKREIGARGVRIVALDLPTSWQSISSDETTSRIRTAVNSMLLDMLAAIARKDCVFHAIWTVIPRQTGQSERSDAGLKGFTLSLVLGSNFPLGGNDAIVF